ncbi:MAG: hypothetical protein HYY50_00730 [Candidatus Kerfeldbacteria bacterium]|nr:hypothetical protein [Candidatus Kerfeldbacteria bacterium]
MQEASVLAAVEPDQAWSVQRLYGSRPVAKRGKIRGFVVKEFLEGTTLGEYTAALPPPNAPEAEVVQKISRATGAALANAIEHLGGVPKDANPMNWIVRQKADGDFQVRNCDVEGVVKDPDGIKHEIRVLGEQLGPFQAEFYGELPTSFRAEAPLPAEAKPEDS